MSTKDFGGNRITRVEAAAQGWHEFCTGPYEYSLYTTGREGEDLSIVDLGSCSVYVLSAEPGASIKVRETGEQMNVGDVLQLEGQGATLELDRGPVRLLVSGTRQGKGREQGRHLTRAADIYKVTKPWGHELWISGEHPGYAFKQVFVKKPTRTSLQYHNFKQETNVLIEGEAILHYNAAGVRNEDVGEAETGQTPLSPISALDISPPTLHRLEAITDITLYETSTPHLDDVIRVQDDARRSDGRIAAEHNANA
jgi:mannose-6-phosphate isomerase